MGIVRKKFRRGFGFGGFSIDFGHIFYVLLGF